VAQIGTEFLALDVGYMVIMMIGTMFMIENFEPM
jgi:hypothetical protein